MRLLLHYLKPHWRLVALALVLAAVAQVLALIDPIIFGRIVDEYANRRAEKSDDELVAGVLWLLALALGIAVLSRLAKAVQEYLTRMVVLRFGTQLFNDGLRQTLRLAYDEFEDQRSGETLSKSLGLTFPEIRRLQARTEHLFGLEMAKVKRVRVLSFLQGTTLSVLKLSVLFALLWLIFRDVLSTGELIAMQFISVAILAPLQELGNLIVFWREADASLASFRRLMARPVERRPDDAVEIGPVGKVRFSRVTFRHRGATQNAVEDISFSAELGETLAFVGPSGSGKSTLVNLLVGLYRPADGEVFYNATSTRELRYNQARRQIGFVTQQPLLFAGTLRENLLFVKPDATDAEMIEALNLADCGTVLQAEGDPLGTPIGESGGKLSGGERQRVSIARALLRKPRLLIFDEATSALDSLSEERITDTVRTISARREQITLLIAHRLSTVMHADAILVLEKGRIVERGDHASLLARKRLYFAMWRQQIGERRVPRADARPGATEGADPTGADGIDPAGAEGADPIEDIAPDTVAGQRYPIE